MPLLAVTAIGADRPGIVADVTGVLVASGCNLEDTSMSILRGHFAMVLIVAAPDGLDPTALERARRAGASDLVVSVGRVVEQDPLSSGTAGDSWTVVVYGADHPGIVHGVGATLATLGVNIVDLSTRVSAGDDRPIYSMVMEVEVPAGVGVDELERRLLDTAEELGVECSVHPSEADIL